MCHTWENVSHLGKCVTLEKMCPTLEEFAALEKNWSHLEKCVTLKEIGSLVKKFATFEKMGHTGKNG